MELKEKDLKLLGYIYHSKREPLTKIAKEIGMTRIQVEHSLNKFIRNKIIEKFFTMFNYSSFGYHVYVLMFFKLEKYSSFQKFTEKLGTSKNCISWGECFGRYDIFTNLIFKDEEEMSNFLAGLIGERDNSVLDYLIIKPYLAEFHPLKMFYDKKRLILPIVAEKTKEQKFSDEDLRLLKELEKDGRIKIIDIAKRTGISAEMVLHKLKKFQRDRVYFGIRAGVKMHKLGYNYSMIFLNIRNLSQELKEKIIDFARKDKRVNALFLSLFNPNCMVQIFHKTNDELKEVVKNIKSLTMDEIVDVDIILVREEDQVHTLPFLK